jgi:hypothetical protein
VSPHAAPALAPLSSPPRAGALPSLAHRLGAVAPQLVTATVLPQPPPPLASGVLDVVSLCVEVGSMYERTVCNAHELCRQKKADRNSPLTISPFAAAADHCGPTSFSFN